MVEFGQMVFWILSGLGVFVLCVGIATTKVTYRRGTDRRSHSGHESRVAE